MYKKKNFDGLDISKISPEGLIGVNTVVGKNTEGGPRLELELEDSEGVFPEDFSEIFQAAIKNIIHVSSQLKNTSSDIFLDLAVSRRQAESGGYIPLEYQRYILCSQCEETAQTKAVPCLKCEGLGRVMAHRRVEVKVPKNIREGEVLKVANEGHVPAGDLFVKIIIKEDGIFN